MTAFGWVLHVVGLVALLAAAVWLLRGLTAPEEEMRSEAGGTPAFPGEGRGGRRGAGGTPAFPCGRTRP